MADPFDPNALYEQYGGQRATPEYIAAVEAAGYDPQIVSGYVPNTQFGGTVLGDVTTDKIRTGELEQRSYAERSGLPTTGEATSKYAYWDEGSGVTVHAPAGYHFDTYAGGGVKLVQGLISKGTVATNAASGTLSSNFDQPANLQAEGTYTGKDFKQEQLAYQPADGKTIARTGQTIFNPATGTDVHAQQGNVLIQYTDGTYEERPFGGQPGTTKPLTEGGASAQELGITRKTEIKNEQGGVARAPMSAAEALAQAKTPEEKDAVIQGEGLTGTANLEFIGTEYTDQETGIRRVAKAGNAFYQDIQSRSILERPVALQSLAKESTSPSVLAERAAAQAGVAAGALPTFSSDLSQALSGFGLGGNEEAMIQALRDRPIPNIQELYTQIQTAQGVPTIQAQLKTIADEMKVLDDKFATDKASVDENPWLSESLRTRKQDALAGKYETQRAQLVSRQQLYQTILQDARQEAQFIAGTAIQQANADREFDMSLVQMAFERADQRFSAQMQLAEFQQGIKEFEQSLSFQKEQFAEEKKQFQATYGLQAQGQAFDQSLAMQQFGLSAAKEGRLSGGGGGGGGGSAGGVIDPSKLSTAAQAVLKNPALLSSYTPTRKGEILDELASSGADTSAFGLPNVSQGARDTVDKFDTMIREASNAMGLLEGVDTGPIAGLVGKGLSKIGGAPGFTDYASSVSRLSSVLLNQLSGAAITPQEYERLKPFIPTVYDDEATAQRKLVRFQTEIGATRENYVNRSTQSPAQLQQSVSGDPLGLR